MEGSSNYDRELKKIKAEEKRQEALKRKKEEENRRKKVIADSLKEVDNLKKPKRIVYKDSDDEFDENTGKNETLANGTNCMQLFDDDSDSSEENPEELIKNRHVGKKAAKLMELESRYGHDERFHLDSKFLENNDRESEEEDDDDDDEDIKHKESKKDLVRPFNKYDPTNPVHVEWMKKYKEKNGLIDKSDLNEKEKQHVEEKIIVEGQFFKVDNALKDELYGNSFSFLSSIGRPEEKPIVVPKPQEENKPKECLNKKKKEQPKILNKPKLNSIVIKKFFINPNTNEFQSIIANFRRTQKEENIKNAFKKAQPKLNLCYQSIKKNTKRKLKDNNRKPVYNKFNK
uniref:NUC153 domain-containing protein n=1 Tax=Strongyloides stercoralis TaxID=6248 RepID=A0A0K0E2P9_STRER